MNGLEEGNIPSNISRVEEKKNITKENGHESVNRGLPLSFRLLL